MSEEILVLTANSSSSGTGTSYYKAGITCGTRRTLIDIRNKTDEGEGQYVASGEAAQIGVLFHKLMEFAHERQIEFLGN